MKQRRGKSCILFNGDFTNTELLFHTVRSVNQVSVYGAVANWCCQLGLTEEEKGRVAILLDNKNLTMMESEEVELLVSPPTQAPALSFQILEKEVQLTQLCEKKFFQHLAIAGNYKIRPNAGDGWGEITPLCREYSSSRSYPKAQALSEIPEGTIIGPVLEVHVVKILGGYGIEVAIQSIANPEYTTYERFLNEIHDHKRELRSSSELLATLSSLRQERPETQKEPFLRMRQSG